MAAKLTPRFGRTDGQVFYAERISQSFKLIPVGTATFAPVPNAYETIYAAQVAMTSALTVNVDTSKSQLGDKLIFLLLANTTARVTTFGTGMTSTGTLTAAISKRASAVFVFDGVKYVEIGRAVEP